MFIPLFIKKYRLISRYSCVAVIKIFIIVPSLKYIAKRSYSNLLKHMLPCNAQIMLFGKKKITINNIAMIIKSLNINIVIARVTTNIQI